MKKRFVTLALTLILLVALVIPASVALAQTGTTGVSGTLATTYTLTPPAAITIGLFAAAIAYPSTPDVSVTATTNDPLKIDVDIAVKDNSGNLGFLTGPGGPFTNELQFKGGLVGLYTDVLITDTALATAAVLVLGTYSVTDFSVQQTIVLPDLALTAGLYSTTLTFTATFNP